MCGDLLGPLSYQFSSFLETITLFLRLSPDSQIFTLSSLGGNPFVLILATGNSVHVSYGTDVNFACFLFVCFLLNTFITFIPVYSFSFKGGWADRHSEASHKVGRSPEGQLYPLKSSSHISSKDSGITPNHYFPYSYN